MFPYFFQLGRECVLLLIRHYFSVLALHDLYAMPSKPINAKCPNNYYHHHHDNDTRGGAGDGDALPLSLQRISSIGPSSWRVGYGQTCGERGTRVLLLVLLIMDIATCTPLHFDNNHHGMHAKCIDYPPPKAPPWPPPWPRRHSISNPNLPQQPNAFHSSASLGLMTTASDDTLLHCPQADITQQMGRRRNGQDLDIQRSAFNVSFCRRAMVPSINWNHASIHALFNLQVQSGIISPVNLWSMPRPSRPTRRKGGQVQSQSTMMRSQSSLMRATRSSTNRASTTATSSMGTAVNLDTPTDANPEATIPAVVEPLIDLVANTTEAITMAPNAIANPTFSSNGTTPIAPPDPLEATASGDKGTLSQLSPARTNPPTAVPMVAVVNAGGTANSIGNIGGGIDTTIDGQANTKLSASTPGTTESNDVAIGSGIDVTTEAPANTKSPFIAEGASHTGFELPTNIASVAITGSSTVTATKPPSVDITCLLYTSDAADE